MHDVIIGPFLGDYLLIRPGRRNGIKIPRPAYAALARERTCPDWLAEAASREWGIDLTGRLVAGAVLIRGESALGHGRASCELRWYPAQSLPPSGAQANARSILGRG